jgi:integrase
MPKTARKPSYLLHKPTGQARVRINGTDHYLGTYGTRESRDRYDALVSECLKGRNVDVFTLTVDELALRYLSHCKTYYRTPDGRDTGETSNIRAALRFAVRECGTVRVRDFGPLRLKAVRAAMIKGGISRKYINANASRIRRMFRWGVEEEIVPGEVSRDLESVAGLRDGRSEAKEANPVEPVSEAFIDAVKPFVSRQVWGMVQTQLFTGMRPGEVLTMRGCDLITTGRVWEYVPAAHKTSHHGRRRVIFLGPQAQAIVRGFLKTDLSGFLFSPTDAVSEQQEARRAARKSPVQPSQVDRSKPEAKARGEVHSSCLCKRDPPGLRKSQRPTLASSSAAAQRRNFAPQGVRH